MPILKKDGSIQIPQISDAPGTQIAGVPVANFSYVVDGGNPLKINFTDISTNAPNAWFWDFGDIYDTTTSNIATPSHTYSVPGNYTIKFTAINELGSQNTSQSISVDVQQASSGTPLAPPMASFTASPMIGLSTLLVSFTDTSVNNPIDWVWSENGVAFATLQNPVNVPFTTGVHVITLTVSDAVGRSSSSSATIIVAASDALPADNQPAVGISSSVYAGLISMSVVLSASLSTSSVGYSWVSSDGQTSSSSSPTFTYLNAGLYTITLTLTNSYVAESSTTYVGDFFTYFIDSIYDKVLIYDLSPALHSFFGGQGAGEGKFNNPTRMCINTISF